MELYKTDFQDLFVVDTFKAFDHRGQFIKAFNETKFSNNGIHIAIREIYYSVSKKNVIRGMHFQIPPYDHSKLIYVVQGSVLDVVLDIRKYSNTFGKYFSISLKQNEKALFIPSGFAHGFLSLEDNTVVVYNQSSCYNPQFDSGILWNSFGFSWGIENPILSERDQDFEKFTNIESYF